MLKNYFKTGLRNLVRNKNYTIINITGLGIGIAVCLNIFVIIQFHGSFDNFHKKQAGIYRVLTEYHHGESKFNSSAVPFGFPQGIKTTFPQVEQIAPVLAEKDVQIIVLNDTNETAKKFKEETGIYYTTPSFFTIFDFPLLAGSYESLKDPGHVILAKETAEKYYGSWNNALGKALKINNTDVVEVTGILSTIPANTDFQIKMAVSYGTGFTKKLMQSTDYDGTDGAFGCYILLPQNVTGFDNQLRAYSKKVKSSDNKDEQTIQAFKDIHYDTESGSLSNKTISEKMINILWLIAAFILLIACVNFINLSTAQAVKRAKEVGVRKVLGSNKWQLQLQFFAETFLIVLMAIILALIISCVALPYVGNILELSLKINAANALSIVSFLAITCFAVTLLAGFYPSIVLSGFNPVNALKSKLAVKNAGGISLRKALVVSQFVIAQALIICTVIIVKQMNFFTTQPLGFDKDAIVTVPLPTDSTSNTKLGYLKQQLQTINSIQAISFNSNTPIEDNHDDWTMPVFNNGLKNTDFYSIFKSGDNDYVSTYNLPLIAGRNMESSDTAREFLVNESFVKSLGISNPQQVLNKNINVWGRLKGNVVGVLKDFNNRSFRANLAPMIITTNKNQYSQAGIKFSTTNAVATMQSIEKIWQNTYPDFVFEYTFLDDKIAGFYKQENQLAYLYKIFASIAIFLSCLGLYGLTSFMAVQRIKEVGVRKVLGATAGNIVYLFSKEFIILIAIGFSIATPIAWYYMDQWLQDYVYHINISWWLFAAGGLVAMTISLATISFQVIKAAIANPVKSLRTE